MNKQLISERIKEIRTFAKLNQSEFGKKVGVSQDTVSLWENARSLPATEYVVEIAEKFEVSSDYILGLKDY
ncbi:MAG: helix-turn-helix domain-containing protein [Corallococcus sp.]|nr:helix-turn-helix domain-containing protein [Corallococcus sp.]MCM1359644.1 helix-turn-helix domain-containing protein [Corallococcus sp.]MCM1395353.1 helix-turn-helix domain-containing protein [Corallococcus sp.]